MKDFGEINDGLHKCCQLAFRQPLADTQLMLTTDACFQLGGHAVLTDDDPQVKIEVNTQNLCPSSKWFQNFYTLRNKNVYLRQNFFAIYLAIKKMVTVFMKHRDRHHCDQQQISNTIFSNPINSNANMQRS